MTTFVDTSALFALIDEDDADHLAASAWLRGPGSDPSEMLVTHNYVVVESLSLIQRRLGASAVRTMLDRIVPTMSVVYVDEELHARAAAAFLAGLSRRVSLVDRVSFQVMREGNLDRAFAFDRNFKAEGFAVVPS